MESWNEIRKVAHVSVCRFTVSEIMFNHDSQSSTSDGLNLLRRYGAGMQIGITAGEWRNGGDMNDPVCYTGGITPTVKVRSSRLLASRPIRSVRSRRLVGLRDSLSHFRSGNLNG